MTHHKKKKKKKRNALAKNFNARKQSIDVLNFQTRYEFGVI